MRIVAYSDLTEDAGCAILSMDITYAKRNMLFRIDRVSNWPLQATRREWARLLHIHYHTLRNAYLRGVLEGDFLDNKFYHTKRQILAWKAPTLLKEMDALRKEKYNSQN